jgi:DnaJ-class molecular chaperone
MKAHRLTMWHFARRLAEYCGDCDGCGWHEGGKALMTKCGTCAGVGLVRRVR